MERQTDLERPDVLDDVTVTQIEELETQVAEDDRDGFYRRAEAYGWSREQADEVWEWMKSPRVQIEAAVEE
jgi:hypothetical protein